MTHFITNVVPAGIDETVLETSHEESHARTRAQELANEHGEPVRLYVGVLFTRYDPRIVGDGAASVVVVTE